MPDPRLPHIPDDWMVWAFSDPHGVTSAFVTALREAGLIDGERRWVAPPRTALIGCGDYIDRGRDVPGLVALLRRLQDEAGRTGSTVILVRGNHERMPLMIRAGEHDWLETWHDYGGDATIEAFGCDGVAGHDPDRLIAALDSCAPGLLDWLATLPHAARWRDVLFVHGGLVPGHGPDDLGTTTEEHLWIRSGFFAEPWDSGAFEHFHSTGIDRVVFGHTPQWDGPTLYHDGHSLCIDTNAVGNPRMPDGAVQELTLLGLSGAGSFDEARLITVPTRGAPDTMRR